MNTLPGHKIHGIKKRTPEKTLNISIRPTEQFRLLGHWDSGHQKD